MPDKKTPRLGLPPKIPSFGGNQKKPAFRAPNKGAEFCWQWKTHRLWKIQDELCHACCQNYLSLADRWAYRWSASWSDSRIVWPSTIEKNPSLGLPPKVPTFGGNQKKHMSRVATKDNEFFWQSKTPWRGQKPKVRGERQRSIAIYAKNTALIIVFSMF